MNREQISALMDGELDDARAQALCAQMKNDESSECWAEYHLIGDALRSECLAQSGFARRFAERLAAEPTVLSPGSKPFTRSRNGRVPANWPDMIRARPWYYGMAAAAAVAAVGLVGWFGAQEFSLGPG
jgi:sigma-E factor negative regulatory protein RseA